MTTLCFDKLRCVTYKDEYSVGNSSYNDLKISMDKKVVGCGSSVFGASKKGDVVILCANKAKENYFVIGVLDERLERCNEWAKEGGRMWEHNFTFYPLTPIVKRDRFFQNDFERICEANQIKWQYMFNSRLCGIRYKPVVLCLLDQIQQQKYDIVQS